MRGIIAGLFVALAVVLAVGCGSSSKDATGTTTVVVTETTAADTTATTDTTAVDTTASTDTSASDLTTTDTTASTDTTATDTTTTGGLTTATGLSAGCQKVADLSVGFGKALSAAGANGSTDLDKTAKAYEAFAQQVPSEIRPAFLTLAKAYAQYAVAIKGIDFKAGQVPDAATIAKLAKAAQGLNNQDLTKANAAITAWVTKNCSATGTG